MEIAWLWLLSVFLTALIIVAVIAFHGRRHRQRKSLHAQASTRVVASTVVAPLEVAVDEPSRGRRKPAWVRAEVLRQKALMGPAGGRKARRDVQSPAQSSRDGRQNGGSR
jgi:hypothetical protein